MDEYLKIDRFTGELVPVDKPVVELNPGDSVRRKEQDDFYKRIKQAQMNSRQSQFIWMLFHYGNELLPNVSKASLVRLIFIATFLHKDIVAQGNKLTDTKGKTFFTKKEIKKVMKLSDTCFIDFWNEMIRNNIFFVNDNNEVLVNSNIFQYGSIKNLNENRIRLYCTAIRRLYVRCPARQHKVLGYVFRMIPFVSIEQNIICYNPEEKDPELIRPMALKDFCKHIDYDITNIRRLLKDLLSIRIEGQQLIKCVSDGNITNDCLIVNPKVYFAGNQKTDVVALFNQS